MLRYLFLLLMMGVWPNAWAVDLSGEDYLRNKFPDVVWYFSENKMAKLSPAGQHEISIGNSVENIVIAVREKSRPDRVRLFTLKAGDGQDQVCSTEDVRLSVVRISDLLGQACSNEDLLCQEINRYSASMRRRLKKTGLDSIRIDDQRCDALWLYTDPLTKN